MASSTLETAPRSSTNFVTLPRINRLNTDVFVAILREVIEEEAEAHLGHHERQFREPEMAMTLSLVCRKWKDTVDSTPYLWSIIKLSMDYSVDSMQAQLDRLASRARGVPVDLHILSVHSDAVHNSRIWEYHSANCCCKPRRIALDFTGLSNVRRLRVHFRNQEGLYIFKSSSLPFLEHVKWVELLVLGIPQELTRAFELDNFFSNASGIVDLRLNWTELSSVSWAQKHQYLMPNLRNLDISSGCYDPADKLASLSRILSHSPNIQELKLSRFGFGSGFSIPIPVHLPDSVKSFDKLRKLYTDSFDPIERLFIDGGIGIPNLQEFGYDGGYLQGGYNNAVSRFFASHESIKAVCLWADDNVEYHYHLHGMQNIEELTIHGVGTYQCLAALCAPIIEKNTDHRPYTCPNLRTVTISNELEYLLPASFEELVRVRCQPINKTGHTAAGLRAIELLRLKLPGFAFDSISTTEAWRNAEVRKTSNIMYELRWSYRPEQTLLGVESSKS